MKTILTLAVLFISVGLSAQTVSKSGRSSGDNGSTSGNSGAKYSCNSSSRSTYSGAKSSGSSSGYSKSSGYSNSSGYSKVNTSGKKGGTDHFNDFSKNENNQTANTVQNIEIKESKIIHLYVKDDAHQGGIYKVGNEPGKPENHLDKDKITTVEENANTETKDTGTPIDSTKKVTGLSAEYPSQNPSPNNYNWLDCAAYWEMSKTDKWKLLRQYEVNDLNRFNHCHNEYKIEDKLPVTCEEFEAATPERKRHILNFPEFYDLSALVNCESYKDYFEK